MSISKSFLSVSLALLVTTTAHAASAVEELLQEYREQGATNFSAAAGKAFWNQRVRSGNADSERSCASCHSADLRQSGKHAVTGKEIKPLAPSVMSKRLTNSKKIRKWLKRNCEWTRGRECTPQEKGDVLMYLQDL